MSKLLFSVPVLLLLVIQTSYAQPSIREWLKVADAAYDTNDFYNAFRYYDAALKYKPAAADSVRILYKYAESARQFNAYLFAKRAYEQLAVHPLATEYPLTLSSLRLAQMYQTLSVYDSAIIHYNYFIDKIATPGSEEAAFLETARTGLAHSRFALRELANPVQLTITPLSKAVNTVYSDFGAMLLGDTLYYTSFQYIYNKDKTHLKRKRQYNKLLTSVNGAPGEPLPDSINVEGDHVAHTAFNRDGSRMYYTVCEYQTLTDIRCDLFVRTRNAQGAWSSPRRLTVNAPNATNTQPSVGFDEHSGQELLFFASDRSGGKGGMDIWCGNINKDGDVATAAPVAEVNTPGNEVTPFFLNLTQTLYFSSDGQTNSMGGYDVYESARAGNTWTQPRHINYPVSTSYDDLYLSLKSDGTMGYLSSNRFGATLIDKDKEACCLDIFQFNMNVRLLATTFNQLDDAPLVGATVELYERTPNGNQLIGKQTNTQGNDFRFPLMPGKKYMVKAMYPEFRTVEDTSLVINTIEFKDERLIELPLRLGPPVRLLVNTFKKHNEQPLNGATIELYESTPAGEQLLQTTDNQLGNNFVFQIQRNKQYVLKAARPYFFREMERVDLTLPAMSDVSEVEKNIYFPQELEIVVVDSSSRESIANTTLQKQEQTGQAASAAADRRLNANGESFLYEYPDFDMYKSYRFIATSPGYRGEIADWQFGENVAMVSEGRFVDTIPLVFEIGDVTLYFDHDYPDPKTYSPTTRKKYDETIQTYYGRKNEFIRALFGSDLSRLSPQDSLELARYEDFFEREMRLEAMLNLERIAEKVFSELTRGRSVEMTIQGFCSPSGAKGYNLILSRRRIHSVENYLMAYGKDGVTMSDFAKGPSPKLKINKEPFGFDRVDPRIRRLLQGSRTNSIYNIAASRERKVVVRDVIIK